MICDLIRDFHWQRFSLPVICILQATLSKLISWVLLCA